MGLQTLVAVSNPALEAEAIQPGGQRADQSRISLRDLDTKDTAILKGLAITAIILHNFFHLIGPLHQNEFTFDRARFPLVLRTVVHPEFAIQGFFTFFGHFGVQVFIFLAAYGLTKSHWEDQSGWTAFMWGRVKKLFPVMGLVVLPWLIILCFRDGPTGFAREAGMETLLLFLGLSTIFGYGLPDVGPWWFIPFIVQFYALWLPLRKLTKKFGWVGLLILAVSCIGLLYFVNPLLARWQLNLLLTPIGRLKSICLGIAAARYSIRIRGWLAALSLVVLLLGSYYGILWPFTFMAALIICLWSYMFLRDFLRRFPLLESLGRYSMLAFLLNGIIRLAFLPYATTPAMQLLFGAINLVVVFACSAIIYESILAPRKAVVPAIAA